jgi:nucleotide-binding universal stress UspA family protein
MKRILVPTDFSTRSDRALRRAALLAREKAAELLLVHVVDDDQPPNLVQSEQREATAILHDLAGTMQKIDGLACETHLALGDPFQAIGNAAETFDADLVVMGPHRRQILREVIMGTTVERTIRQSQRPVIMANAVPAKPYQRILVATDFSDCSALAVQTARKLGFLESAEVGALHAFDAPPRSLMLSASMTTTEVKHRIAEEEARTDAELGEFLRKVQFKPRRRFLLPIEYSAAAAIRDCARKWRADLVVLGTHGKSGVGRILLGSVTEEVLRESTIDVLTVPPIAGEAVPQGPRGVAGGKDRSGPRMSA